MTRAKPTKFRAAALRLLAKGLTTREVAAALRKKHPGETFSEAWVRKVEAAPPESEPTPEPVAPVLPATPEEDEGDLDTYELAKAALAEAKRSMREARRDANHTAAQRFSKQVGDYTLLLARLDKARTTNDDVVTIPRVELERARQAMRDRIAALASDLSRTGGLVCSSCGRDIRIALAKGEDTSK